MPLIRDVPEELAAIYRVIDWVQEQQNRYDARVAAARLAASRMPDFDEDELSNVMTIIDWIDEVNSLSDEDPDEDDDESSGAGDPMNGYELDGDEDEDGEDE